jgi:hypothetical protein
VFVASVLWIARVGEPKCAQSFKTRKLLASRDNGVGKRKGKGQSRLLTPEMAMKDKWVFLAFCYGLMLATLAFAIDAGIAAMVVFG